MTVQLKNLLLGAAAGSLLLLALQGCGDSSGDKCNLFEYSQENTVNIRLGGAATSLNPLTYKTGFDPYVFGQIFQCLALVEPQTMELVPLMIKKVPVVRTENTGPFAGALAYDFEIYENAQWDNGSPITAHDVIFTLKMLFHPKLASAARYQTYFQYLRDIVVDPGNPKKFTAYFSQYYLLALESLCQIGIMPAYHYDPGNAVRDIALTDLLNAQRAAQLLDSLPAFAALADSIQSPRFNLEKDGISGSGPYRLESYDPDQGCVLVRKQNWWGDQYIQENPFLAAFPAKLQYRFLKDDGAIENLIRSGGLDIIPELTPLKFDALSKDSCLTERYDFSSRGVTSYGRVLVNHKNPILADKRVRQALAHAIDYDYLINTVIKGYGSRVTGPVNPAKSYYAKSIKPYDYNIEKARALLAEAGWKDSDGNGIADKVIDGKPTELTLNFLYGASAVSRQLANSIATSARNAGFNITTTEKDLAVMQEMMSKGEYDLSTTLATLFPGYVDLYQTHHSKSIGKGNRFFYSNPAVDALIEAVRTEPDEAKRGEKYARLQQALHEDVPEIILYAPRQRIIVSKRFNTVLTPNRPGYYEQFFRIK